MNHEFETHASIVARNIIELGYFDCILLATSQAPTFARTYEQTTWWSPVRNFFDTLVATGYLIITF